MSEKAQAIIPEAITINKRGWLIKSLVQKCSLYLIKEARLKICEGIIES